MDVLLLGRITTEMLLSTTAITLSSQVDFHHDHDRCF
jgi:hypothetical protein